MQLDNVIWLGLMLASFMAGFSLSNFYQDGKCARLEGRESPSTCISPDTPASSSVSDCSALHRSVVGNAAGQRRVMAPTAAHNLYHICSATFAFPACTPPGGCGIEQGSLVQCAPSLASRGRGNMVGQGSHSCPPGTTMLMNSRVAYLCQPFWSASHRTVGLDVLLLWRTFPADFSG